ncbi:MAG: Nramp family divalent metal transporter [Chloroflexota bacterium]|nr:Nramp family divalent metal transporter [Chloroflexota bacterium]
MRPETDLGGRAAEKHAPVHGHPVATVRTALTTAMPAAAERLRRIRPRRPNVPRGSRGRVLIFLSLLGPGIVTASAGNDAGGIATYASAGAQYGYGLIWTMVLLIPALAIVQEMCARMGAVTGKGLTDLIREEFSLRWTAFVMLVLLIANGGIVVSEFAGIAAAFELFHVSKYLSVPLMGFVVWYLIAKGSYRRVERVFLGMALLLLSYPIAAFLSKPDWGDVAHQTVTPHIQFNATYLFAVVTIIGTTISPYMQMYIQSSVAEKGVSPRDYAVTRADVYIGSIFANLTAILIIVATGATLFVAGKTDITSAADAAQALKPVAGSFAGILFGVGLLGASLLAAGVLPLATAYGLSEAFGFEKGVDRGWRDAPVFLGIFTGLIAAGVLVTLIPGLPLVKVLVITQLMNALALPFVLVSVLKLVNNRGLMGEYRNGVAYNIVAWATTIIVSILSLAILINTLLGFVGLGFA